MDSWNNNSYIMSRSIYKLISPFIAC